MCCLSSGDVNNVYKESHLSTCVSVMTTRTLSLTATLNSCLSVHSRLPHDRDLQLGGVVGSQANSKVSLHQLEKLSRRLIKMYSLPLEDFPYTAALNARKSLHFILVQRYRLRTVSDTNLDELLKVGEESACLGRVSSACSN